MSFHFQTNNSTVAKKGIRAASVQTCMSLIKAEPNQGGLRLLTTGSLRQQYCSLQILASTLFFPGKSSVAVESDSFQFSGLFEINTTVI